MCANRLRRSPASSAARARRSRREPLLEIHDIQGDILAGFNKDHQALVAIEIRDVGVARRWLARIAPSISSTAEVLQFNDLFRLQRAKLGTDPRGLVATWVNLALSHGGLATLTSQAHADSVPDMPFRQGLPDRAGFLGDAGPAPDPTRDWVIGGTGRVPDLLLIVASDDPRKLADVCERVRPGPQDGDGAPEVMWQEVGDTRVDLPGHEHFGFKDGISQPAVRGLVAQRPDVFLSRRVLAKTPLGELESARPGQPLVWPGQFVFGYQSTDSTGGTGGGPVDVPPGLPRWIKNGSLLVFRRLRQDVAGFTRFVHRTASQLTAAGVVGMSPERLGALMVGRWASGTPIARAPNANIQAMAEEPLANNDFLFTIDTPTPVFAPGVKVPPVFPTALEDRNGIVCPHAAHIRKVNPRDQDSNLGDQFDTLARRILRRGIPYGTPLMDPSTDDGRDRGLHFLCFQTSIEFQFEVLQQNWANHTEVPTPGGHDLVIGQTASQHLELELLTNGGAQSHQITTPSQFVKPTGGGYFFAPSISFITDVLATGTLEPRFTSRSRLRRPT
jgi:Dyp-type peroxidase family